MGAAALIAVFLGSVGSNVFRELAYGYWAAPSSGFFRHNEKNRLCPPCKAYCVRLQQITTAINDRWQRHQQADWSGGSQHAF